MRLPRDESLLYGVEAMEDFQGTVERFLEGNPEVAPSTLGRSALNDYAFVQRLRDGMDPRLSTAQKVLKWMREYVATKKKAAKKKPAAEKSDRRRTRA